MSAHPRERFEPWAFGAFALGLATLALFLYLGTRPGGETARTVFRYGPLLVGGLAAVFLLGALLFCLRRRPVLQRRRAWPLAVLGSSLWFCSLPIAYPSPHEGKYSPTPLQLPFTGRARVRHGGEDRRQNPLLFDPTRRFGVCFEPAEPGAPLAVVAPCAGQVVASFEDRNGWGLVLQVAGDEFCVLEGLATESPSPVGAAVASGERLGEAHGRLVLYLSDSRAPGRGEGIPVRFQGYRLAGRAVELGVPAAGQELEAGPGDG